MILKISNSACFKIKCGCVKKKKKTGYFLCNKNQVYI